MLGLEFKSAFFAAVRGFGAGAGRDKIAEARLKVLVIEDSPEDCMALRHMLETGGFEVSEADRGAKGVALAKELSPDCILLDYSLPDMDGLEVLEQLRSPSGELPFAVVTLTGVSNAIAAANFLKGGGLDYLEKQNLSEDSLRRTIYGSVGRFRMMEEHRKLQQRNAQLAAVVNASADAILCVGVDLVVRTWNPGAEIMFGFDEAEAIGRRLDDLIVPEESRQNWQQRFPGSDGPKLMRFEERRRRKDGTEVSVEVTVSPIEDEAGRVNAVSVVYRDIGGQKAIEAELIAARAEAERANRAKSTFLAAASHDLRQPVQSLMLLFSIARRQTIGQPEVQKTLTMMKVAIDGLQGLLTSVIDISRLDAGVIEPVPETIELGALLMCFQSEYVPRAAVKGLELRVRSQPIYVRADPNLLGRALRNLIENALRYTRKGGILLGARRQGDLARIDVFDTGVGIPTDKHFEIFEEFHQLLNPGRDLEQGLGLGLAIVYRLAKLLGAKIEVASNPGRGSRFSLLLPMVEAAAPIVPMPPSPVKDCHGRVLIIEDNAVVRQSLEGMLKIWGYETFAATSGEAAFELAEKEQWRLDLILADHHLGGGTNGIETIREIERRAGRSFPALMLTGETASERIAAIKASGIAVMQKPVDAEDLKRELFRLRQD